MEKIETSEKAIYKLNICGRQGELYGLFIAEKSHVRKLIDDKLQVYFGEVLGKHSEIYGSMEEKDIIFVSDSLEAIRIIEEFDLENGHNPFHYSAINHDDVRMVDATVGEIIKKRLEKI